MDSDDSVSQWISGLKAGESAAAEQLWEKYFRRLVGLARKKLGKARLRTADEEDVALSAFKSLWRGAERGKFPLLSDRDNLWSLLVLLTSRKATDKRQFESRQKRGGGRVAPETDLAGTESGFGPLGNILTAEPSPEFSAMMAEECEQLLALLDGPGRQLALSKLDGYTNEELAEQLGVGLRTIERKLELIRRIWSAARDSSADDE